MDVETEDRLLLDDSSDHQSSVTAGVDVQLDFLGNQTRFQVAVAPALYLRIAMQ